MIETNHETNGSQKATTSWPDLAEGLYAFLTGRGATIEYQFEDMQVWIPSSTHAESPAALWKVNGTMRIRTNEK